MGLAEKSTIGRLGVLQSLKNKARVEAKIFWCVWVELSYFTADVTRFLGGSRLAHVVARNSVNSRGGLDFVALTKHTPTNGPREFFQGPDL